MKIKKIKSDGAYIYPATIAAAVKDANFLNSSGNAMTQGEINQQVDIDLTDLKSKSTPTMWVNILATKDTAVMVDGSRVEIPAYTNVALKDFKTFALADNTPDPKCITRFDIHYNGIASVDSINFGLEYLPTDTMNDSYCGIPISNLDLSCLNLGTLSFSYNGNCTEVNIYGWNTNKIESGLFMCCEKLTKVTFDECNIHDITSMDNMFYGCPSLKDPGINKWNTSSVTNMSGMFYGCPSLADLDLSSWDTSKVTDMDNMFGYCLSLKDSGINKWNTSSVTNMSGMFYGCSSLADLDLSSWDTSKVTYMYSMFYGCSSLADLDLSSWDTSKVTHMSGMFYGCSSLIKDPGINKWNTSSVTNMSGMFHGCSSLADLDLRSWDTSKVTDMGSMFSGCSSLTDVVLHWDTSSVTNMGSMFSKCNNLNNLDIQDFDGTCVGYMYDMLYGCYSLTDITFGEGFGKAKRILTLDLSTCGSNKSYVLTDNTYSSMLTMYDRATNGLSTMTIKFNAKHNLPDGFVAAMTARGYTITQA